jgi:hypothetical protein
MLAKAPAVNMNRDSSPTMATIPRDFGEWDGLSLDVWVCLDFGRLLGAGNRLGLFGNSYAKKIGTFRGHT